MTPSVTDWGHRLSLYARLARLNRPIGNFLLLWPTLWALWLAAEGMPRTDVLVVFVLGVLVMRAAGCVINDYADRDYDRHVKRTRARPLTTGAVTEREALILFAVLCLVAFALVLLMNRLTVLLSLGGVALAATYPFMKRHTHLPQVHLGAAFGWAAPMAFAAQTGTVPVLAWLVFASSVVWATIYDTEYAMVDRDDDLKVGIKSTAVLFGAYDRAMIALLQVLLTLLLAVIGWRAGLGAPFLIGLVAASGLFVRQQWLIRDRSRDGSFQAFLNNNIYGGIVFAGIVLSYLTTA
ncbi:4-hydroxybenzoate octaprenyltransferase [Spiribacter vilamensis]|uniref:4-hydroxybenzoate octaprenyltransferase n=1 Tax=Spiribacter vilamensis TaxID=531306 RepID=A0A4Q8D1N0_9GAMM|nr:4-hydroxybenzoate octaprenyltransferase [Spiribacter vilamensis]RZU99248.1 4-hydroxybenzoate polyprenyltransferase [Spiribacter vilamensis]TVO61765.1 4-hydroxybenzoate octaprenyltransferase [Spiribacter vilamensis]